jgi:hypothetical protein
MIGQAGSETDVLVRPINCMALRSETLAALRELLPNSYKSTKKLGNSWIQSDFKNRSVSLSYYTLKSDDGIHHLLE